MTAAPPLSCYIRTKNEARMIGDVVRAAFAVADDVVIVDSGSTDDTVQIAEAAGARVVRQQWLGNGHQKRVGEEACRHDFVLDLDADEIVTPELAAEIRGLFDKGAPPAPIYSVALALAPPVGPPWLDFGLSRREKLYDRRVVRAPAHAAWDQFEMPPGVAARALASPLVHHAFTGAEHLIEKLNKNSSTRARELPLKSRTVLAFRIVFGLPVYFAKRYVLGGFFRGGLYGFAFAMMSAFGRWLRDVKMFERLLKERAK